jgi:imidazolonepropionase-like amidohydrolase
MTNILASLLFLLLMLPAVLPDKPAQAKYLAFTHVTVIDATGAPAKPDMTILIKEGRIAALGKGVHMPDDAKVVDASGKFLIPGLWDMHVHSLYEGRPEFFFPMFIANGVTGVREMASTLPLEQISVLRRQIERGEVLGPRFGAVGGKILESPVAQLGPEFEAVASADEARKIVRSRKEKGADFVKVYNQLPRDVYFAIADEAKKQHIPFAGHVPLSISAEEASDAGQRSIEHLTQVLPSCSSRETEIRRELATVANSLNAARLAGFRADAEAAESYDRSKAATLFARFRRNGTWQCPTLAQRRKFVVSDDPNFINDRRLKYIPASARERWRTLLTGPMAQAVPYAKRSFPKQVEMVGTMRAAGVMILAGSDAGWGNPYTFAGFSLQDELGLLVQAGLTPMQALQTATINPAKFLNLQDKLGTVEQGKIADLVLLEANPLDDITNTQRIAGVVVNGRYLPKSDLQKMLADVEAAASKK